MLEPIVLQDQLLASVVLPNIGVPMAQELRMYVRLVFIAPQRVHHHDCALQQITAQMHQAHLFLVLLVITVQ
jgi:hypothetical protein